MTTETDAAEHPTHWNGCWRDHHRCAVVLLDLLIDSPEWDADCREFGCHDE